MVKVDGRVSRARLLRESRRASVLAVARRIFAQKGYHDTSIDDLIEGADIEARLSAALLLARLLGTDRVASAS